MSEEQPEATEQPIEQTPEQLNETLKEQLQRLQAEFDNYRKRIEREQEEAKAHASEKLLRELLPIIDNFELSLLHAKDKEGNINGEELVVGITMIRDQLHQILEHQGLSEIPTEGRFDPKLHEVLNIIHKDGAERGTILESYQRGYLRNGKVFRAAKVSVAK